MGKTKIVCTFQDEWLDSKNSANSEWLFLENWLSRGKKETEASCQWCNSNFSLGSMGRAAVTAHTKTAKHQKKIKLKQTTPELRSFIGSTSASASAEVVAVEEIENSSLGHDAPTSSSSSFLGHGAPISSSVPAPIPVINPFIIRESVTKAEIIWTLYFAAHHYSFRSSEDLNWALKNSLPDSEIAKLFALSRTKLAYNVCFGLAPYFKKELVQELRSKDVFVVCFDEAFNRISQKCQLDVWVRFWDSELQQVESRYLNSTFLGHSTAADLLDHFKKGLDGLNISKILQISRDGPNVNWKFIEDFKKEFQPNTTDPGLLEIGSCGLHVVHGALKDGHKASGFAVDKVLRNMYYLFKSSPARREDYENITGSTTFAKKFCGHRWLENGPVVETALNILPNFRKYVAEVSPQPSLDSFDNLVEAFADPFLEAKLKFFQSVVGQMEPFLRRFQTAAPMAPFLMDELDLLLRRMARRFIKSEIVEGANTATKLLLIDRKLVPENKNFKDVMDTDIGLPAKNAVPRRASEFQKRAFYDGCKKFLVAVVSKIAEKCPLRYELVRGLSALSPVSLSALTSSQAEKRFDIVLTALMKANRISSEQVNNAREEFYNLIHSKVANRDIKDYRPSDQRLDHFWRNLIGDDSAYQNLWKCFQTVLILSHGNATVESGFSVNEDMLVPNLQQRSLISLRLLYDKIISVNGFKNVVITQDMIRFMGGARARCSEAEEESRQERQKEKSAENDRKRKLDELKELKAKKKRVDDEQLRIASEANAISHKISELSRSVKK